MRHRQLGLSLMEMLVAAAISVVVATSMVILMANTLGTGTRTIEATRLGQEVRSAMQVMSRELRRANYHGNFMRCFGNVACRNSLEGGAPGTSAANWVNTINITDAGNSDCIWFWYDRDSDGTINSDDPVSAFRRGTVGGVGTLQMSTTVTAAPGCNTATGWVDISDPQVIDVIAFNADDSTSFTDTLNSAGATQGVEKIELSITARLVSDNTVQRTIVDHVKVRNDVLTPAP